jgi:hypothetical protein
MIYGRAFVKHVALESGMISAIHYANNTADLLYRRNSSYCGGMAVIGRNGERAYRPSGSTAYGTTKVW